MSRGKQKFWSGGGWGGWAVILGPGLRFYFGLWYNTGWFPSSFAHVFHLNFRQ